MQTTTTSQLYIPENLTLVVRNRATSSRDKNFSAWPSQIFPRGKGITIKHTQHVEIVMASHSAGQEARRRYTEETSLTLIHAKAL